MFTKDEYKSLTDEFTAKVQKSFGDDVAALLQVGSAATAKHIPGESDCNFLMVLKATEPDKQFQLMRQLGEVQKEYLNEPLFASMFDLHVLFEDEIPTEPKASMFNWVHANNAKKGKTLIGTNPFEKLEIPDELIKISGQQMVRHHVEEFKDLLLLSSEDEDLDIVFIAVDTTLRCAVSYLNAQGIFDIPKSIAPDAVDEHLKGKFDTEVIHRAHRLRLASKEETTDGFVEAAFAFCMELVKSIR